MAPEKKFFDQTFSIKSLADAEKAIENKIKEFAKCISNADNELTGCVDYQTYRDRLATGKRELEFALEILRELKASEPRLAGFNQKRIEQTKAEIDRRIKELEAGKGFFWQDEMWRVNLIDDYKELRRILEGEK